MMGTPTIPNERVQELAEALQKALGEQTGREIIGVVVSYIATTKEASDKLTPDCFQAMGRYADCLARPEIMHAWAMFFADYLIARLKKSSPPEGEDRTTGTEHQGESP